MKTASKMSSADRRIGIINAARRVFVEKGFYRTTTRELAEAAGVSEALLFKHFPSKEALYSAIQKSCFKEEGSKVHQRLESLEPSTSALVFLVRIWFRMFWEDRLTMTHACSSALILRSLMDEGEFTRLAIQGGPLRWVKKVEECIKAANRAGDMLDQPVRASLAGWMVHQLISGIMVHSLPGQSVIDYGVSHEELVKQVVWFCLHGMGLKEEAIRRCYKSKGACKPKRSKACSEFISVGSSRSCRASRFSAVASTGIVLWLSIRPECTRNLQHTSRLPPQPLRPLGPGIRRARSRFSRIRCGGWRGSSHMAASVCRWSGDVHWTCVSAAFRC